MSLLKLLPRILVALSVLMLAPTLSRAQGVPWYTIPLPIPNGFVDAAIGNVHLEIPIGSVPQRNRDPLVADIVYDNTQYAYNYNVSGFTATGPGFRTIAGTTHSGTAAISVDPYGLSCPPGYPNGNVSIASSPSFVDIQGTAHTVVNSNLYTKQVNCYTTSGTPYGSGSDITSFNGLAADGSGYTFQVSNYTQLQVRSADGWLVYDSTGVTGFNWPMDTNGNYVQSAVAGMPDTLNRSPFQIGFYSCASASKTITVRASDGSTQTHTMTCTSQSVSQIISGTQYAATESFLTGIALPDGTSYSFTYDTGTTGTHLGGLLTVTRPAGGTVSFTQVPGIPSLAVGAINLPGRAASVTFGGGTWNLSYVQNSSNLQVTTTVLSPPRYDSVSNTNVNDKTVFTSVPYFSYNQTAQYYSGSSTLLRTVTTTYDSNGNFLPVAIATTLNDTGQSSSVSYQYFSLMRNYPTQKQETDFTGTAVRTTKTTYAGYMKPTSINVYAGAGTGAPISSTLYSYDEYSANYCKNGIPGLTGVTGATGHDDNYGIAFTARGNATTIQHLISGTTYATTHMCYDTLGNVTQTVDGNGNPTTYDYSENWADTNCIPAGTLTHAFPTTVTDALGHRTKKSYFTCTSLIQSTKDENDIQAGRNGTTYTYNEFNRPITINYPDGGQTTYCYSHDSNLPCYTTTLPPFTTESRLISGTMTLNTKTLLDSYGRVSETQLTSDPDCASGDRTDTTYDGLGRVRTVSNPYCAASDSTYGVTTYSYDALGRTTQVTHPDGSSILTSYTGRATQVQDEGNGIQSVTRISQTDALGRLSSLCEVAPGPFVGAGGSSSSSLIGSGGTPAACGQDIAGTGFLTSYQYDTLGNLTQVNQNGIGPRTFAYDSLSRLTSATNPESGTISYTYDPNGNLTTKTDARNITTTYSYDALHRLTQKSYSDGTPTATFIYDSVSGFTSTNAIGRLVESTVPSSIGGYIATFSRYDPVGRTSFQLQLLPLPFGSYYVPYAYDLMGNMTSASNGWFNTYTYSYNPAARLTAVTDSISDAYDPPNILSNIQYNAGGQITSDTLGTGEVETYTYTKRNQLQAVSSVLNSTPIYSYSLTFAPNGNLTASNDSVNGNWNYSYDQFNRLVCSNLASNGTCSAPTNGTPTYSYVYDRFGNRWQQNGPNSFIATFTGNNPGSPANNNRMDGYSYDAAGNLLNDGTHSYFYDAENRLIQVDGSAGYCSTSTGTPATACYTYDANGYRIRSTGTPSCDGPGGMEYVYDIFGRRIMNVNSYDSSQGGNSGTACLWEIYAGNRHIGNQSGGIRFDHHDWLGTVRLMNSYQYPYVSQYVGETCTSLPFGDALTCVHPVDTIHFTGKERDSESGLDNFGARYDSSSLGRFMSPDAFYKDSHVGDPQSWNEYAYARNNPLRYVDPTGENATVSTNCTTDEQNHTACNVNVSATIAIYAAPGSGLTQEQLNGAATTIQSEIQNAWSGSFTQDGVTYNVSTQVSVSVVGSEADAMKSGAQNVIGLSNGPISASTSSAVDPSVRHLGVGPDTGVWNYQNLVGDAPHEFSHLLGMQDRDTGFSIANHLETASFATSADLSEALGRFVEHFTGLYDTAAGDTGGTVQRGGRPIMAPGSPPQTVHGVFINTHIPWRHWWR